MKFQRLEIENWRQYSLVEIDFSPSVTILTGANGAGKSTILRLLSQHFGWGATFLGTPVRDKVGPLKYVYGILNRRARRLSSQRLAEPRPTDKQQQFGDLFYSNGSRAQLTIPAQGGLTFNVAISQQQPVQGLFIPSHRPVMTYQPIANISTTGLSVEQAYEAYFSETSTRYNNGRSNFSPTYRMKEALVSMATFGPGNENVSGNSEFQQAYDGFQEVLRIILPTDLGFQRLSVRLPEVVLITTTGDFIIDAASGGLMSLIDLAWQIFLYSQGKDEYVVILDEPENHLHPSMQRQILDSLTKAFPAAQFIIASHSPFIVSSVKAAKVYVLKYDSQIEEGSERRTVSSVLLDQVNMAGSASEILRDALGVPVTIPMWAEAELRSISREYSLETLTPDGLSQLKVRLNRAGLGDFYPDALQEMATRH